MGPSFSRRVIFSFRSCWQASIKLRVSTSSGDLKFFLRGVGVGGRMGLMRRLFAYGFEFL